MSPSVHFSSPAQRARLGNHRIIIDGELLQGGLWISLDHIIILDGVLPSVLGV